MSYLEMDIQQLIDTLLDRDREIQALRKDAERYRVVRSGYEITTTNWIGGEIQGEEMDAYVDRIRASAAYAAMEQQK